MSDLAIIRRILRSDPIWAAYALADLHPPYQEHSRWTCAETDNGVGVVLLYTAMPPPILMVAGAPGAVDEALAQMDLPEKVFISSPDALYATVSCWYDNSQDRHEMVRMVLPAVSPGLGSSLQRQGRDGVNTVRLDPSCEEKVWALYAHGGPFTPDYFDPRQLSHGVFYGVVDKIGQLIAVGGTHVVCAAENVAAIGNVYTHPDHRRLGHARTITQLVIGRLQKQGIETIVLNVNQRNQMARRMYGKLGFVEHCSFVEGNGILHARE